MVLKISSVLKQKGEIVLAADVGATKTNIAICKWNGKEPVIQKEESYKTSRFENINSLLEEFVGNDKLPHKIVLAVAGPVLNNQSFLTNIGWTINADELSKKFKVSACLVNDLEAAAYGLGVLNEKDIHVLHKGSPINNGNIAIIAPGTGLGEAGLICKDDGYMPFASEGGHTSFAPITNIDIELLTYLRRKFNHVSWERIVSGPGICNIYDFLYHEKEMEEPVWLKDKILAHDKATVITQNVNESDICKKTVELFLRYVAEESGNLVLKLKATGGLFITGGILPQLITQLHEDIFVKHFCDKGRVKDLLQPVPVKIVMNKKAPLLGAAYYGILNCQ